MIHTENKCIILIYIFKKVHQFLHHFYRGSKKYLQSRKFKGKSEKQKESF